MPLVSVVIPAFRAEEFIEYTMRSVAAQSHRPLELIVVDDCSPDRTGEIAEELAAELTTSDFTVRVEHHEVNQGGAGALLTGFTLAAGEFICWLSADDAFVSPEKTSIQLRAMESGAGLSYCGRSRIGASPDTAPDVAHHWSSRRTDRDASYLAKSSWRLLALNIGNPINGSSVMIRRSVITDLGTFDPTLRNIDQDSDMWLRLSALGVPFAAADVVGTFYRIHEGQTSNLGEEVEWGCALTRVRVLRALLDAGHLGRVLDEAWPVLLLARSGQFRYFALVSQALCVLGTNSGCGPIPRTLLAILRGQLKKRGYWNPERLERLFAAAADSATSDEFQRFTKRLQAQGETS